MDEFLAIGDSFPYENSAGRYDCRCCDGELILILIVLPCFETLPDNESGSWNLRSQKRIIGRR